MLWRVRTALPDRPGALAVLAHNCGAAGVNILSLQIFPDMGSVTDELVLRTPADWGIAEIGRLLELSGGRAISSSPCTPMTMESMLSMVSSAESTEISTLTSGSSTSVIGENLGSNLAADRTHS